MNTPVNFELAKLLKEKGFDKPTYQYYQIALTSRKDEQDGYSGPFGWEKGELNVTSGFFVNNNDLCDYSNKNWFYCSAPTIAEIIIWLYEKHQIWIEVTMGKDHNSVWFNYDIFSLIKPRKDDLLGEDGVEYEDDPNEKYLNYKTTYDSMIDELYLCTVKESHSTPAEAYREAINYILNNLIKNENHDEESDN